MVLLGIGAYLIAAAVLYVGLFATAKPLSDPGVTLRVVEGGAKHEDRAA